MVYHGALCDVSLLSLCMQGMGRVGHAAMDKCSSNGNCLPLYR